MKDKKMIFLAYEMVRKSGKWNMYDPRAKYATRLSNEEYMFVMKNYSELAKKYKETL